MLPHTRAMVAAATFAYIARKPVAGVYDHAANRRLPIAAEARGDRLLAFDEERSAEFGGSLPELYDAGDKAFVSLEIDGARAKGYDRTSSSFYTAQVEDGVVQVYDHEHGAWFAYDIQDAAADSSYHRG